MVMPWTIPLITMPGTRLPVTQSSDSAVTVLPNEQLICRSVFNGTGACLHNADQIISLRCPYLFHPYISCLHTNK